MELLRKHFTFHGRAGRLELLWLIVAWIGLFLFARAAVWLRDNIPDHWELINDTSLFICYGGFVLLAVLGLCISVRRAHDLDKSGASLLLSIIPVIGWFSGLQLYFKPGTKGPNKYGLPSGEADPQVMQISKEEDV